MPIPNDDVLCRFIRPGRGYWNPQTNEPLQRAFKQVDLSVWHQGRLHDNGVALHELLIENLSGYGQAHHTVQRYLEIAQSIAQEEGEPFQIQIEWRPNAVTEPWRQWRYAHVQVEVTAGPQDFPLEFRRRLAANAQAVVPPAQIDGSAC